MQYVPGNINAVTLGAQARNTTARDVWAIADMRLQKWSMSVEGWEELLLSEDVSDIIRHGLRETFESASEDDMELDLELLDLKLEGLVIFPVHLDEKPENELAPSAWLS